MNVDTLQLATILVFFFVGGSVVGSVAFDHDVGAGWASARRGGGGLRYLQGARFIMAFHAS